MDELILYDHHGRPMHFRDKLPKPLPSPQPKGDINGPPVELVELQSVDIISGSQFAAFSPNYTGGARISFCVNTAGISGVLSMTAQMAGGTQVDTPGQLKDGVPISAGQWKDIPIQVGGPDQKGRAKQYSLSFAFTGAATCNVTIQVIGPVDVASRTDAVTATLIGRMPEVVYGLRNSTGAVAHRGTVTAPDLLGASGAAPTVPTVADSGVTLGALTAVATYAGYYLRNGMGITMASVIGSVTPTANHAIRVTIPVNWQLAAATYPDAVFGFFLSTAAAPLLVTEVPVAAMATGGLQCTAVGAYAVAGSSPAWSIDIAIVGTGPASSASQFAQSTAYLLSPAGTLIPPFAIAGYQSIDLFVDFAITQMWSNTVPQLILVPVYLNDKHGTPYYHAGTPITVNVALGVGQALRQVIENLSVNSDSVIILVAAIANVTVNRIDITPVSVV